MHDYDEYLALFVQHGGTAESYLTDHYQRFVVTLDEFRSTWPRSGGRVLDVDAHWLHQAVMWKQTDFDVTAVDLPGTFEVPSVQSLAHALPPLIGCKDLERAKELYVIPTNSMDIVLFTEIFEHITFNPIHFWRHIYRILTPGGRLVVTTPNYYSWKGRAWQFLRYISGKGGGISVDHVLQKHTYAHHWREYSQRGIAIFSTSIARLHAAKGRAHAYLYVFKSPLEAHYSTPAGSIADTPAEFAH